MATNYEILMSLSRKQMSSFIRSLVTKDASRYIDWASWLNSEDPEPSYIGKPAFTKDGEGERACYLLEETDDNGKIVRTIYTLLDKGEVRKETLPVHLVRTADEETYQPEPLPEISEEAIDEAVIAQEEIVEELLSEAEAENSIVDMTIDEIIDEPEPQEASKKIEDMIAQEVQEPEPAMDEDADISDKITAALIESEGIVDEHIDLEATTELPVFAQEVLNEINGEQPEEEPAVLQDELNFDDIERVLREEDDALMETTDLSVISEDIAAEDEDMAGLSDDLIDELLLLEASQFMDDDYFTSEKNTDKLPDAEERTAEEVIEDIREAAEEKAETEEEPASGEEEAEEITGEIQEEAAETEEELTAEATEAGEETAETEEAAEETLEEEPEEVSETEEASAEENEAEAETEAQPAEEEESVSEAEEEAAAETPSEEAEAEEETEEAKQAEEQEEPAAEEAVSEIPKEEPAAEADQMIVDEIELPEEILAEIGAAEAVLSKPLEEAEDSQAEEPAEEAKQTAAEEVEKAVQLFDEEDDELPDIILDLDQPKTEEKEESDWNIDDLFDEDLMKELDDAVNAADQAESQMTASLRLDELEQKEEPVKEESAEGEDEDDVYFFSKGRIELLKEQLFDEDEPPAGKDELLFKETTAIEFVADKDGNEIRSGKDDISINELPQPKTADPEESQKIASFFDSVNMKEPIDQQEEEQAEEAEPEKEPEENEVEFVFEDPRSAELQRFLEDVKHRSMLFDPDDPEDLELPTIAFSAMADEKENYF